MKTIAVLGVGPVQGRHVIKALEERMSGAMKKGEITLKAIDIKERNVREISCCDKLIKVTPLEEYLSNGDIIDVTINTLSKERTEKWADILREKTGHFIDLSPYALKVAYAEWMSLSHLVAAKKYLGIPHITTLALLEITRSLAPLKTINKVTANALWSASELGKPEMDELFEQSKMSYIHQEVPAKEYRKKIAFNIVPLHGVVLSDGQTQDEWNMRTEFQKFHAQLPLNLSISYAPVFMGTSINIHVDFDDEVMANDAREHLAKNPSIIVMDDERYESFATPIDAAGAENILVSRVREDWSGETGLNLFACADNLTIRSQLVMNIVKKIL